MDKNTLGFPPMPPQPGPVKSAASWLWDRKNGIGTTAGLGGLAAALGGVYTSIPSTPAQPPAIVKPAEGPSPKAQPPKVDKYAADLKVAWDLEDRVGLDITLKRLLYCHRNSLERAKVVKTQTEWWVGFDADAKKLGMTGRLPHVREVILIELMRVLPPDTTAEVVTDADRSTMIQFVTHTIAALEKL